MQTFEQALREQAEKRGGLRKFQARRIERVLNMPRGPRRQRRLEAMEARAIKGLLDRGEALPPTVAGKIDWSQFPWEKFFEFVIKLVEMLLKAFT